MAILESVASAVGIAGGIGSLFSNDSAPQGGTRKPFKDPLSTGAFNFGGGQLTRTSSFVPDEENRLRGLIGQNRLGVSSLRDSLAGTGRFVGDLGNLAADVTPGFGRLTESQVQANRDREAQERGNLRESLRERRVFGSSFGSAAEHSLGLDFAREEERIRAESFIAELDLSRQLVLDQATLELALNEQDAALLNQDLVAIQTDAALLQTQINRELSELDIATEFLAVVNQKTVEESSDDLEAAADSFDAGDHDGDGAGGSDGNQDRNTNQPGDRGPGSSPTGDEGGGGMGATLRPFSGGLSGGATTRFGRLGL